MINNKQVLACKILTYSGILPLFLAILLKVTKLNMFNIEYYSDYFALTYSAIIISFVAGIHWSINMYEHQKISVQLFIFSNLITLLSWSTLLINKLFFAKLIQIICFIALFVIDYFLYQNKLLEKWFFNLRRNATLIVSTILILNIII